MRILNRLHTIFVSGLRSGRRVFANLEDSNHALAWLIVILALLTIIVLVIELLRGPFSSQPPGFGFLT